MSAIGRPSPADASRRHVAQLRAVLEAVPAMMWLAAPDGAAACFSRNWLAYTGLSEDISEGGIFIATQHILPIGTPVRLTIRRGEARNPLIFEAAVVRVGDPREGRFPGVGVRFEGLTELDQGLLDAMLGQTVAA